MSERLKKRVLIDCLKAIKLVNQKGFWVRQQKTDTSYLYGFSDYSTIMV